MKKYGFVLLVVSFASPALAQINQERLMHMRDSLDNLLMVSPTSSSILVRKGEVEIYSFNSLLSSSDFNDREGNAVYQPLKYSLFNSLLQLNFGVSRSKRINIGIDANYRAYRYDPIKANSALMVFGNDAYTQNALTYAGLRVRIQPFRKVRNFTWQSYVWLPVAPTDIRDSMGSSKMNFGNTFFFYTYLAPKVGLFAQANVTLGFPSGSNTTGLKSTTEFYLPLSLSLSYVVASKNIFFGSVSYSWLNDDVKNVTEGADHDFCQYGIGYQRIVSRRFFVNLNYAGTIFSRNYGVWSSANLGIRYLY